MDIKILITDQERTFAEALAARLNDEQDIEVAAAVQARTPARPVADRGEIRRRRDGERRSALAGKMPDKPLPLQAEQTMFCQA